MMIVLMTCISKQSYGQRIYDCDFFVRYCSGVMAMGNMFLTECSTTTGTRSARNILLIALCPYLIKLLVVHNIDN